MVTVKRLGGISVPFSNYHNIIITYSVEKMKDNTPIRITGRNGWSASGIYLACGASMGTILILDLWIPLGASISVAYILAVLISLGSSQNKVTVAVAVVCSIAVIGAVFFQPPVRGKYRKDHGRRR